MLQGPYFQNVAGNFIYLFILVLAGWLIHYSFGRRSLLRFFNIEDSKTLYVGKKCGSLGRFAYTRVSQRLSLKIQASSSAKVSCIGQELKPQAVTRWPSHAALAALLSEVCGFALKVIKQITATVALFVAIVPFWPYGYYTLLRLIVCGTTGYAVYQAKDVNILKPHRVPLIIVAILFNPLMPVHLTRQIWLPIDLCAGIYLIAITKKLRSASPSPF